MKRLMLALLTLIFIGGPLFSFFYFGNTTGVEDNPAQLQSYDPVSGLFRVSFFSFEQGKTTVATAPLARVSKLTGKRGECALALLKEKYMNYFSADLNQDGEFEWFVIDDESHSEVSFNDQLVRPMSEWLPSCSAKTPVELSNGSKVDNCADYNMQRKTLNIKEHVK